MSKKKEIARKNLYTFLDVCNEREGMVSHLKQVIEEGIEEEYAKIVNTTSEINKEAMEKVLYTLSHLYVALDKQNQELKNIQFIREISTSKWRQI